MAFSFQCSCGMQLTVASSFGGTMLRCPDCNSRIAVPGEDSVRESDATSLNPVPTQKKKRTKSLPNLSNVPDERWPQIPIDLNSLVLWSMGWCVIGLNLSLMVPWLGTAPEWFLASVNVLAPVITVGLIFANLVESYRLVRRSGEILSALPLTLTQVILFTLLFFQICCHLGADNFTWEETPQWYDWTAFAAMHAVRAADIVDALESLGYGTGLQRIRQNSVPAALAVVAYHLVLDLFFLSVLMEYLRPLQARFNTGGDERDRARRLMNLFTLFFVVWLVSALVIHPWRWIDIFLWPIDNLLRVVDFADAMEIFQVRLHLVPNAGWDGTLTMACRFLFGAVLLGMLEQGSRRMRLQFFGGFGLNQVELEEFLKKGETLQLRRLAEVRIDHLNQARNAPQVPWQNLLSLSPPARVMAGTYVGLVLLAVFAFSRWSEPVTRLTENIVNSSETAARAHAALRRMGSYAENGITELQGALERFPRNEKLAALETLGAMGKRSFPTLRTYLEGRDEDFALVAVSALARSGPESATVLVYGLRSTHSSVRRATASAFSRIGRQAAQSLIDHLSKETYAETYGILENVDPYWNFKQSQNALFKKMVEVHTCVRWLKDDDFTRGIAGLAELGEYASPAIPFLIARLNSKESGHVFRALVKTKAGGVPTLVNLLDDPQNRTNALVVLNRIWTDPDLQFERPVFGPKIFLGLLGKLADARTKPNSASDGVWQQKLEKTFKEMLAHPNAVLSTAKSIAPLLGDTNEHVRYFAVWAVGQYSLESVKNEMWYTELGPQLRHLLNDPQPTVRSAAEATLNRNFPWWRSRK